MRKSYIRVNDIALVGWVTLTLIHPTRAAIALMTSRVLVGITYANQSATVVVFKLCAFVEGNLWANFQEIFLLS
jgi:hypothetical protein